MSTRREVLALASGAAVGAAVAAAPASAHGRDTGPAGWVATWAAAPTTIPPDPPTAPTVLSAQTVRHVAHCSAGGDELRIRLTNEFGDTPLRIGAVHVARRSGTGASTAAEPGSDRRVTFGGAPEARIPAGAPLLSDPVRLSVRPGSELVISLYLPGGLADLERDG